MCTLKPGSEVCIATIQKSTDPNKASDCPAVNSKTSCGCLSKAPTREAKKTIAETAILSARRPKQPVTA